MKIDSCLPGVACRPSPNHGVRKQDGPVDILILHYTGMESGQAALDWLCSSDSHVSAHYFIDEDGGIIQSVREECRAWHAGKSFWQGETDINSRSIGIEIVNPGPVAGFPDFLGGQIEAVIDLCGDILTRHPIPAERVLAHSDIAPGRKIDPGEKFPWAQLSESGIGVWLDPAPIRGGRFFQTGDQGEPVEALQAMLGRYGYDVDLSGHYDAKTEQVVAAFQRHFRPGKVDGIADVSTIETLHRLLVKTMTQ